MDFGFFVLAAIAWFLFRGSKQKKFKPVPVLIECVLLFVTLFLLSFIGNAISTYFNISISPWDYLPNTLYLWIGGILFFAVTCYLAFKPWRKTASYENDEK
ncbi:hypothetical protein ACERII_18070 [Evansella sp. AB-rgal1]|uniref:hypothetical protein n=1 Tax=Evansella sp. AB-rgal1 TaxID=3242696 RepID=UPI00359EB568